MTGYAKFLIGLVLDGDGLELVDPRLKFYEGVLIKMLPEDKIPLDINLIFLLGGQVEDGGRVTGSHY